MPQLSDKRLKFVQEYLVDFNATQAAIRAGYAPRSAGQQGDRLLKNEQVKAAIEAGRGEQAEQAKVDAQWVLDKLIANVHRCEETGDTQALNRACELISRHTGGFDPKQRIEHTGRIDTAERHELEQFLAAQGIDPDTIRERALQ